MSRNNPCKHLLSNLIVKFYTVLFFVLLYNSAQSQTINWKYLPDGDTTGVCISRSDYSIGTVCYGLEYTPGTDGLLTSYTMGFFIQCPEGFSPPITSSSCLLSDNTLIINSCETEGAMLLQASAQEPSTHTNVNLTAGEPVILHQVCLEYYYLDTIDVVIDDITGITMSINGPNGPVTDEPPFLDTKLNYGVLGAVPCSDTVVCSVDFAITEEDAVLDTLNSGVVASMDTTNNHHIYVDSFDVYDEVNIFCGVSGGQEDFTLEARMLKTYDVYGNGALNEYLGDSAFLLQDSIGITNHIPFGTSIATASSSGDVRGYEVEVHFKDHISITANQLNFLLRKANSDNSIYESASVIMYGLDGEPYGKTNYKGYYQIGPDLSGACTNLPSGDIYESSGNGVIISANTAVIDMTNPCSPQAGTTETDSLVLHAVTDGGLHPLDRVTGFKVTIIGEDIATPSTLDLAGILPTNTSTVLKSSFLGFAVEGCVFKDSIRDNFDIYLDANPEYLSADDSIVYNMTLINRGVDVLDPVTVTLDLPSEVYNVVPSTGGIFTGLDVIYPSIEIPRLDTQYFDVKAFLNPNTPSSFLLSDAVDGVSTFENISDHHTHDGWQIDNVAPQSGSLHWYASSETSLSVKYLRVKEPIVPTDSTILSFYHRFDTELHKDGGQVLVSLDDGVTWIDLGQYFTANGYNDYINNDPGQSAFSGTDNSYALSQVDLSPFKDKNIYISFRSYSDCEVASDGWYIDDISVSNLKYTLFTKAIASHQTTIREDILNPYTQVVPCTDVYTTSNEGNGSLRRAISCAQPLDTILFMPRVYGDTIQLSQKLDIAKDLLLNYRSNNIIIDQSADQPIFDVASQGKLTLKDINMLHSGQNVGSGLIINGELILEDVKIKTPPSSLGNHIQNQGVLEYKGEVKLQKLE